MLLILSFAVSAQPALAAGNRNQAKSKRAQARLTKAKIVRLLSRAKQVSKKENSTKRQKTYAKKWVTELGHAVKDPASIKNRRYNDLRKKIDEYLGNSPSKSKTTKSKTTKKVVAAKLAASLRSIVQSMSGMSTAQKKRILTDIGRLEKGDLDAERIGYIVEAVDGAIEISDELQNLDSYPMSEYRALSKDIRPADAAAWREPKKLDKYPLDEGATSTNNLRRLNPRDLSHRLRLMHSNGKVTMSQRAIPYPWPAEQKFSHNSKSGDIRPPVDPFHGNIRHKKYRKIPLVFAGMFGEIFKSKDSKAATNKLFDTLTPTNRGTYELFADKVQVLFPDRKDSPKGQPTHLKTYLKSIRDAKFVWGHIYQLSHPEIFKAFHEKAKTGVPVYLTVGNKEDSKQALDYFSAMNSKVKVVTSAQEYQGADRSFRIDHNKSLFTLNAAGEPEVIEGGINGGELSSLNIDTSYKITGGNFALDVLNNLMFHTLRAKGTIHTKDLRKLSQVTRRMLVKQRTKTSIELETAVTSSRVVGRGRIMEAEQIFEKLKNKKSLVIDGASALAALKSNKHGDTLHDAMEAALSRGKHLVFSMDSDMSKGDRKAIKQIAEDLKRHGLEIFSSSHILVDNSARNLAHGFVRDSVAENSNVYSAAFAHSDGWFNKMLVWASKTLHERGSKSQVHVTSPDLNIHGTPINQNATGKLLWAQDAGFFKGTVTGIHHVDGDSSANTGERKWHSKLLLSDNALMMGSVNFSKIGFEASEERAVLIKDKSIAKKVLAYKKAQERRLIKNDWAKKLTLDMKSSKKKFAKRPSLTKSIPKDDSNMSDHVYIVMDLETDGLSQPTDGRITQMAGIAMEMDENGNLRKANPGDDVSDSFNQYMSVGKDHYGRDRKLDPRIKEKTGITENMLRYQPEMVDAFNHFNAWVRHIEYTTGKTPILVMHNKNFDHNMYNAWASTAGVIGNPVVSERNVFCTLRAQEKFRVARSVQEGAPISSRVNLQSAKDSWDDYAGTKSEKIENAHRADADIGATAEIFEAQVKYAMKHGLHLVEEMQLADMTWSKNNRELIEARVVDSKKLFYDWSIPRTKTLKQGSFGAFGWAFRSKKSLVEAEYGAVEHGDMSETQFQVFARIKEARRWWQLAKSKRAAKENHRDLPEPVYVNQ